MTPTNHLQRHAGLLRSTGEWGQGAGRINSAEEATADFPGTRARKLSSGHSADYTNGVVSRPSH